MPGTKSAHPFRRAWRGEERLWKTVWLWGSVAYGVVLVVFLAVFWRVAAGAGADVDLVSDVARASGVTVLICLPVEVWFAVATWRCAANVNWRGWFFAGRALALLSALETVWILASLAAGLAVGPN